MAVLAFLLPLRSQSPVFEHYAVSDGISQSEIICIWQDREGYMWFGTQNGLNKFDGYSFVNYLNDPYDTTTLSNNWIFDITEDHRGDLWIATKGGLNKFDKKTGLFTRVNYKGPNSVVTDNFVYGLCADTVNIYVNIPPELSVINVTSGNITTLRYPFDYSGILYDKGVPVIKATDGRLWAGTHHGLYTINPATGSIEANLHDPANPASITHNHITALYQESDGRILAGTEKGLNIISPLEGTIDHLYQDPPNGLSHNLIRAITQDHTGSVWIATEGGGLNKMNVPRGKSTPVFHHYRSGTVVSHLISHDIVYALREDHSQNLWIGTIAGIDKIDLKNNDIRIYKRSDNPESVALPDNIIASVYKDERGNIWAGTWGKGLVILDPRGQALAYYSSIFNDWRHIPEDHAHVLFRDRKKRMWLGTRNGVAIYNPNERTFIDIAAYFGMEKFNVFNNIRVYTIIEDSHDNIWIGTGNGVFIINPEKKEISAIKAGADSGLSLGSNLVYSIMEDSDKEIWMATSNGLDRLNTTRDSITHYIYRHGVKNGLCDNFTISLCEDKNADIWIGTTSGLNVFNKTDSLFTYYSVRNGLPGNIIYDIIEDNKRDLWFSTGKGLAVTTPVQGSPAAFQVVDELAGQEFNIKAVFRNTDGEMFFGGMNGLVSLYPDSLKGNSFIPPIKITSVEKENNTNHENLNAYSPVISLTYKDYSFTISFAALEFTNPQKNRYAYQMQGISPKWNNIGTRHYVHFTKLPPGDYVFRVKGTNNDGIWNDEPTSLKIHISPPWWQSKVAYLSYFILTLFLIILLVYLRERNLLREKKILEGKVNERTAEIERQKEKAIESEIKLKSTINSLDDLVFVLDNEGVFQEFYNPRKRDINFRHPKLYISKHYKKAGIPAEVIPHLEKAFATFKGNDEVLEFDYSFGRGEKKQWYNAKISPRRNLSCELTGIVIVAREITDRKKAEEMLQKQKEELKDLNNMKDKFFSILAHDLKNPFTNLYSLSDLVIRNYHELTEDEKMMALKNIHKSARFIYTLLENLLSWANSQRGRIEFSPVAFNIVKLIEINANLHKIPASNKGIGLEAKTGGDIMAYGDRQMIDTVIRNLVSNAVKFTSSGGKISIEARKKDKYVEVEIRDSGVG
ncbi:MAG TPA: two-component regulator propeller domain-containing protein, partial [Bacteroidales bacterium]|nr:two-component regulator propeller domain-containing protein [Bacteroidales bacterium]